MKRMLISAFSVSPLRGSECAVGWEISKRLGKYFDVTVLMCETTPSKNEYYNEVLQYFEKYGSIQNVNYIPVKIPKSSQKFIKLHDYGFWPAFYWGYKCWQKEAYHVALHLHSQQKFDIAYQLNMIGFREPGFLWKLNIPFIWGPINGFHCIPFSFILSFKGKELIFQSIKHIANKIQIKLTSRGKEAARKAKIVWCVDKIAYENLIKWGSNVELMQETGLVLLPQKSIQGKYYDGNRKLIIVWSGMINSGKALHILIKALIKVKLLNFQLMVLGSGPLINQMKKLALPINDKIIWEGWITREQALEKVKCADILIHTSLKEGTPHSILEAIGLGVPVICHDTCGMGLIVNDMNGFKIPYINNRTSINDIAKLLEYIVSNPNMLNDRFQNIWSTTEPLSWDNKVNIIAERIIDCCS